MIDRAVVNEIANKTTTIPVETVAPKNKWTTKLEVMGVDVALRSSKSWLALRCAPILLVNCRVANKSAKGLVKIPYIADKNDGFRSLLPIDSKTVGRSVGRSIFVERTVISGLFSLHTV